MLPWSRCFAGAPALLRESWRRGSGKELERREEGAGKEERENSGSSRAPRAEININHLEEHLSL